MLARLTVDRASQSLGSRLRIDALRHSLRAVATYVIVVAAKRFYKRFGFRELRNHRRHLYLPLSQTALSLE